MSLRMDALRRDKFKCQLCGFVDKSGRLLRGHHMCEQRNYAHLIDEPANIITLCHTCHAPMYPYEYKYASRLLKILQKQHGASYTRNVIKSKKEYDRAQRQWVLGETMLKFLGRTTLVLLALWGATDLFLLNGKAKAELCIENIRESLEKTAREVSWKDE